MVSNTGKFFISIGIGIFISILIITSGYIPSSKGEANLVRYGLWAVIIAIFLIWKKSDSKNAKKPNSKTVNWIIASVVIIAILSFTFNNFASLGNATNTIKNYEYGGKLAKTSEKIAGIPVYRCYSEELSIDYSIPSDSVEQVTLNCDLFMYMAADEIKLTEKSDDPEINLIREKNKILENDYEIDEDTKQVLSEFEEVKGADWKTFEDIKLDYSKSGYNFQTRFAKDKNNVYLNKDIIPGADPETFVQIFPEFNEEYQKDKSNIYYQGTQIKGADLNTFHSIENGWRIMALDKNHVYDDGVALLKIDRKTFKVIDAMHIQDKNALYYYDFDTWGWLPVKE